MARARPEELASNDLRLAITLSKLGRETGQGRYRPGSGTHLPYWTRPESSNTYPVPQVMGAAGSWHQIRQSTGVLPVGDSCRQRQFPASPAYEHRLMPHLGTAGVDTERAE